VTGLQSVQKACLHSCEAGLCDQQPTIGPHAGIEMLSNRLPHAGCQCALAELTGMHM